MVDLGTGMIMGVVGGLDGMGWLGIPSLYLKRHRRRCEHRNIGLGLTFRIQETKCTDETKNSMMLCLPIHFIRDGKCSLMQFLTNSKMLLQELLATSTGIGKIKAPKVKSQNSRDVNSSLEINFTTDVCSCTVYDINLHSVIFRRVNYADKIIASLDSTNKTEYAIEAFML